MNRQPKTPQQFRDHYQIGKTLYHKLVNAGALKLTYLGDKSPRILPEDEAAFIATLHKSDTAA